MLKKIFSIKAKKVPFATGSAKVAERKKKKKTKKTPEQKYDSLIDKIRYYRAYGQYKEAINYATKCIDLDKTKFEGYLHRSYVYMNLCNEECALEDLEFINKKLRIPQYWRYIVQGDIHSIKKSFVAAMNCYKMAVAVNNKHWYGHFMCGYTYNDLNLYSMSNKKYKQALKLTKHVIDKCVTYNNIGVNFRLMLKPKEALKHYNLAIKNCEAFVLALKNRASLHKMYRRNQDLAISDLTKILEITTDLNVKIDALLNRGRVYDNLNEENLRERDYNEASKLSPRHPGVVMEKVRRIYQDNFQGPVNEEEVYEGIQLLTDSISDCNDIINLSKLVGWRGKFYSLVNSFSLSRKDHTLQKQLLTKER